LKTRPAGCDTRFWATRAVWSVLRTPRHRYDAVVQFAKAMERGEGAHHQPNCGGGGGGLLAPFQSAYTFWEWRVAYWLLLAGKRVSFAYPTTAKAAVAKRAWPRCLLPRHNLFSLEVLTQNLN
jgi:hypothetical protein